MKRRGKWLAVVLFLVIVIGIAYAVAHLINQTVGALPVIADKAIPSIIQCMDLRVMPRNFTNRLPFNRKNIFARDHGCCVYCGVKVTMYSGSTTYSIGSSVTGA